MPIELLVALIAAGAAVVSSVAAQIVGAVVSASQTRRRLIWDQKQAELNRYADLRWQLFGDVMATLHVIDREVNLCEERAITQRAWDANSYLSSVETLQILAGRTRLVDASLADELLDFLDQARDCVEEWMIPGWTGTRRWEVPLSNRVSAIGVRLATQLGMPNTKMEGSPRDRELPSSAADAK